MWPHLAVQLDAVVEALDLHDGDWVVDCTLGAGGHAERILELADTQVLGIDRDPAALEVASRRLARFGGRFRAVRGSFGDLEHILGQEGLPGVNALVADLGVSSIQLDTPERGFSFREKGPLSMQMDPDARLSALEIVQTWSEADLVRILFDYGEERNARRIARGIVEGRPWTDTLQLAQAIASISPKHGGQRIHPATRTFQAIRIAVNDELGQLESLLLALPKVLLPGGRLAILTFHSLEDRLVKQFLAKHSGRAGPRDPYGHAMTPPLFSLSPSRPPSPDDPNPRARSSRLRSATRLP